MANRDLRQRADSAAAGVQPIQAPHQHTMGAVEQWEERLLELVHFLLDALPYSRAIGFADGLLAEISETNRELAKRLTAIERVAGSAEKASDAVGSLADAVASETLPRINVLADELARASRRLNRLAGELKDQPQSVVFGRKAGAPGPGEPGFDARGKAQP